MSRATPTRPQHARDHLADEAPADAHWHYTMVPSRVAGLFDIRATLSILFWFVNVFEWWRFKLTEAAITAVLFIALEMRRTPLDVAYREFVAWLRGPDVPPVATRARTSLTYQPVPRPPPTASDPARHHSTNNHRSRRK